MKSSITSTMQRTLRAALLVTAAGAAFAGGVPAAAQTISETRSVTSTSNADNAARVEVRGDRYVITLNGKEVKSGTLADAWTEFDLVDENGETVGTVTRDGNEFGVMLEDAQGSGGTAVGGMNIRSTASARRDAIRAELDAARAAQRGAIARAYSTAPSAWGGTPPRTMLGVTLENPGEALSAQLGVDRENATILTSITDGLPASKAGLKLYDIITEVDGTPASPERLRELLRVKNPGDTLNIKYVSAAARKDAVITLEAYDASRLNSNTWTTTGSGPAWAPAAGGTFTIDAFDEDMEEKARQMEELGRQLGQLGEEMARKQGDAKALDALAEQMNKIGEEMSKRGEEMARAGTTWNVFPRNGQGGRTIIGRAGSGGAMPFIYPAPPTAPSAPSLPNQPTPPSGWTQTPNGFMVTPNNADESAAMKERMDKMDAALAELKALLMEAVQNKNAAKPKDQ